MGWGRVGDDIFEKLGRDGDGLCRVWIFQSASKNMHSVLHSVRRGKGQGREGEVGRARSTRGPGDQRGPRGISGEGGEERERGTREN